MTPDHRRHHSPKGNRCVVDDELLALVLQMIVSSTLNHSLYRFGLGRREIRLETNLGKLEIKVQMVGLESLDLNT